jgi:hypothetical protein
MNIELESMAIEMPAVEGHPNREPSRGVLTLVDVASDRAPSGARGVELYLKLQSLFNLGPDEQANVAAAIAAGLSADADTISAVESWKKQVGLG